MQATAPKNKTWAPPPPPAFAFSVLGRSLSSAPNRQLEKESDGDCNLSGVRGRTLGPGGNIPNNISISRDIWADIGSRDISGYFGIFQDISRIFGLLMEGEGV